MGNIAHLEVLGIDLDIGKDKYTDAGFVDISDFYFKKTGIFSPFTTAVIDGMSLIVLEGDHNHHYVFYSNLVNKNSKYALKLRGHEETHTLEKMSEGGLEILAKKILQEKNVRINFKEIPDKQIRAEIGGIYALSQGGFNPRRLRDKDELFLEALNLYEEGRI